MTEISEHAVLRFLERVKGINLDAVRAEMTTPALAMADAFGCPVLIGRNGRTTCDPGWRRGDGDRQGAECGEDYQS